MTNQARQYLGKEGYDEKLGARPIRRLVEEKIHRPLSQEMLFGQLQKGGKVKVDFSNDRLIIDY